MSDQLYMARCIELASRAGGSVGTNPNVGAMVVYQNQIIGEGFHEEFGGPHAEVNAINDIKQKDIDKIPNSTLYVTLEPCNHHGKTPPCTHLILEKGIKKVVIGCEDPNPQMAGSSVQYLRSKGIDVKVGIEKEACLELIRPFATNILKGRPFVTIKFAQSKDFYLGLEGTQTWLSNKHSKYLSHKLRQNHQAILIGTNTAVIDNPQLNNRLLPGKSPLRILLDRNNTVPKNHFLLSDDQPALIINQKVRNDLSEIKEQWTAELSIENLLSRLYKEKEIARLIVEGGSKTIKHFYQHKAWDDAYVITTERKLESGIKAPNIQGHLAHAFKLGRDQVHVIHNT